MTQKKKNNIIIGSLCAVVLLMAVGYAAFSSILNIKGTTNISSNWKVLITNVESKNIVGTATNAEEPTWEDLTATFKTNLVSPGDAIEYDITVENQGNLNAVLDKITLTDSNNSAIKFTSSGLEEGSELNAGDSKVFTVKVEYDNAVTEQPENTEGTFTVTLDYSQKGGTSGTPGKETAADKLIATETTSGDGLYADDTESGRYIYKGTNPANYITFNNESWRILSVENDGTLKIIRNESIGNMAWDVANNRSSSTSSYCTNARGYGCNAWAATANLVGTPSIFTLYNPNGNPDTDTTSYSGTVTQDASLNTYLNTIYYNGLGEDKQYIVIHSFNVGTPGDGYDTEDIATDINQEALYKWNGKIGLMNVTDLLKATTNTTCTSLKAGYGSGSIGNCNTNNWMWIKSGYEWTISPCVVSGRYYVWMVHSDGCVFSNFAYFTSYGVRPVLYLTSDIQLDGEGTSSNPYTINS